MSLVSIAKSSINHNVVKREKNVKRWNFRNVVKSLEHFSLGNIPVLTDRLGKKASELKLHTDTNITTMIRLIHREIMFMFVAKFDFFIAHLFLSTVTRSTVEPGNQVCNPIFFQFLFKLYPRILMGECWQILLIFGSETKNALETIIRLVERSFEKNFRVQGTHSLQNFLFLLT